MSGFSRHDVVLVYAAGESARTHPFIFRRRSHVIPIDVCEHLVDLMRQRGFRVFEHMHGGCSVIVGRENTVGEACAEHHAACSPAGSPYRDNPCAGACDRYFDRIRQRETYICFLRRAEEPDTPFYTIEVEPGGTIRQHRGMYDEEPGIEEIRPFLREWQQVIKKRITEQDRHYARISAVKREENIKELEAKNNTRVLQGLMEDFMEAI